MKTRLDLTSHVDSVANHTVVQMTNAIKDAWASEAKNRLKTTANDYVKGLKSRIEIGTEVTGEVYLEGSWANKLEHGFAPHDMKPMLARSNKKKLSEEAGQWYLHVPFRHTTPAATGRTGSPMTNAVYNQARKMPQWGKLSSSRGSSWGKYEGLQKVPESPTSSRSSYMTWRTVSSNSPSTSFVHPGFPGVHIARDLSSGIEDTFSKVFAQNIGHALGQNKR